MKEDLDKFRHRKRRARKIKYMIITLIIAAAAAFAMRSCMTMEQASQRQLNVPAANIARLAVD